MGRSEFKNMFGSEDDASGIFTIDELLRPASEPRNLQMADWDDDTSSYRLDDLLQIAQRTVEPPSRPPRDDRAIRRLYRFGSRFKKSLTPCTSRH